MRRAGYSAEAIWTCGRRRLERRDPDRGGVPAILFGRAG